MNPTIPIQEKANLTINEAAAYSNIGRHTLRRLVKQDPLSFCSLGRNQVSDQARAIWGFSQKRVFDLKGGQVHEGRSTL